MLFIYNLSGAIHSCKQRSSRQCDETAQRSHWKPCRFRVWWWQNCKDTLNSSDLLCFKWWILMWVTLTFEPPKVLEAHRRGFTPTIGYELNPWLVRIARFHAWRAGQHDKVQYRREDLWKVWHLAHIQNVFQNEASTQLVSELFGEKEVWICIVFFNMHGYFNIAFFNS